MNIYAGYMSESKMLNPDCDVKRPFHVSKSTCNLESVDCVFVPEGYNCKTFSNQDTLIDDPNSPKATKSQMETCIDEFDCQAKLVLLICIDPLETSIKNLDLMQIYCSKPNGFNQMIVKQIREDAAKKAIYNSLRDAELTKRNSRNTSRAQIRALISSLKTGTDLTLAQRRKLDLLIIRKLIDE